MAQATRHDRKKTIKHVPRGSKAYEWTTAVVQTICCVVGLIVLSPVMFVVAILVKASSPGPVLYRGRRIGRGGKLFTIYKFRTLLVGSEEKIGKRLLRPDDPYYHRFGALLKRTKLDELPQLFNVLKGEMRLVGPRPLRRIFFEDAKREIPYFTRRFLVKPGITGLAQLRGGYWTSLRSKVRYDLLYLKNRSVWLDTKIILLTGLKLLHRWVTAIPCLGLLLLFVSFVPASYIWTKNVSILGLSINLANLLLTVAGVAFIWKFARGQLVMSRSPVDWPIIGFVGLALVALPFSPAPGAALRGVLYYCVTGFLVVLLVAHLRLNQQAVHRAAAAIGLLAASVAAIGLIRLVASAASGEIGHELRAASHLGSPVALSSYLTLCLPLVLYRLVVASDRRARLFWCGAGAVVALAGAFSQTRIGVVAIGAGGLLFILRARRLGYRIAPAAAVCGLLLCAPLGGRFQLARFAGETKAASAAAVHQVAQAPVSRLLVGSGAQTLNATGALTNERPTHSLPGSMYLRLLLESGVAGLLIMAWLVGSALWCVWRSAKAAAARPEFALLLWSLCAGVAAFLVALLGHEGFLNLTTQVLFWALVGLAMGLCARLRGANGFGNLFQLRLGH